MTFRYSDSFNNVSTFLKTDFFVNKSNNIQKAGNYKDEHGK